RHLEPLCPRPCQHLCKTCRRRRLRIRTLRRRSPSHPRGDENGKISVFLVEYLSQCLPNPHRIMLLQSALLSSSSWVILTMENRRFLTISERQMSSPKK